MFLLQYEKFCEVQDKCQTLIHPFQTLIQLLYYTMARGEKNHANVRVVERRVALLLRVEQTMDKERDIRHTRSDTHVLNIGPTQAQPIKGVLQHLTKAGRYLPFVQVLGVHLRCKSQSSSIWSHHWHELKIPFFNQHFPSFAHNYSTQSLDPATPTFSCALASVMYN